MLMYIGPTLLIESFVEKLELYINDEITNDEIADDTIPENIITSGAITAFMLIIKVCRIALKWEIDEGDIEEMERYVCIYKSCNKMFIVGNNSC